MQLDEPTYRPSRPLRPGELWDVCSGKFIRSLAESTGTTRKLATASQPCMMCSNTINIGDEYEEDLVVVCCRCTDNGTRSMQANRYMPETWPALDLLKALWLPITLVFARLVRVIRGWGAPMPPHITRLTSEEVESIQPILDEYCTGLTEQGRPWSTLAALIRELNANARNASDYAATLEDVRWRLNEGLSLLREPLEFNSKFDQKRIREAKDHFTQAHRLIMFSRHKHTGQH